MRLPLLAVAALATACDRAPRHPVEIDLTAFGVVLEDGVPRDLAVEAGSGPRRIVQPAGEALALYVRAPENARLRFTVRPGTPADAFAVSAAVDSRDVPLDLSAVSDGDREAALDAEEGAIMQLRFENREQLGVAERTVLVVTADHGEALGNEDDGRFLHGHALFEELVHVPLVLVRPWLESGRRVREVVSLVDLAPTLADLAIDPAAGAAPDLTEALRALGYIE